MCFKEPAGESSSGLRDMDFTDIVNLQRREKNGVFYPMMESSVT
jgi:hypothetical protein